MSAPAFSLSCPCFPPTSWWQNAIGRGPVVALHTAAAFRHAMPLNRYWIATASGPMLLSLPLTGGRRQQLPLKDLEIDYKHAWQRQHWGALYSAYGRAPFFAHYGPELEGLIFAGHKWLLDFNMHAIEWLRSSMRLDLAFDTSSPTAGDERPHLPVDHSPHKMNAYHQVFEDRLGFLPNLSAIDLLMAEGPYSGAVLR